jgi:ATP-dependent DNA ligase
MVIFKHACSLGCEGIGVGSAYRAGRVDYWLKVKDCAGGGVRW